MASIANHPVFAVFDRMRATVESKANDYADDGNVYSNFEGAAHLAGTTVDEVFMTLIGVKVERLRQLMSGKEPNHEAIDDTRIDLANYAALWQGYAEEQARYLALGKIVEKAIHRSQPPLIGSSGEDLMPDSVIHYNKHGLVDG